MKEFLIFVCTDCTEIFFSKLGSAVWTITCQVFFTDSYCGGWGGGGGVGRWDLISIAYWLFSFVLFLPTFMSHRATQIFLSLLFENSYSLAFKLVLLKYFHGLSSMLVRLFSGQCVFLNFVLQLTASLRTLAIYPPPQPPPPKKNSNSVFSLLWSWHQPQKQQLILYISFLLSCITWQ